MAGGSAAGRDMVMARPAVSGLRRGLRRAWCFVLGALCLASCTVVHRGENGAVTGVLFGTDADAVTIDGPPPVITGWQPVMDKKTGVVTGYQPIYGTAAQPGEKALLAGFGLNNSKSFGKGANVVTTTALGMIAAGVTKAKDAATAANEAKSIDAASKTASQQTALAAQQEANRSKEALAAMELPTPAVP